jgi:hypothetical protein
MARRTVITVVFILLVGICAACPARAQQPITLGQPAAGPPGWTFNVAPYLWIASVDSKINFNLPPALGGTVSASPSIGFGDLVSHLNFATMATAEARYDRFSLVTDFLYLNLGGTAGQFRTINFSNRPSIPISVLGQSSQGLDLNTSIWTLAGGYTLAQGDWGNFDAIAGFRFFDINTRIDYSFGLAIAGPRGNGASFGRVGGVSGSGDIWNGIGGFRGRIRVGDFGLFIPYYFDIGAGGSNLTWQISSGLGYHTGLADLSLTYRYLSFEQGNNAIIQHLDIKGPLLMVSFKF